MSAHEITELKRTVAQLDKAYTDACMDKRALEGLVDAFVAENAQHSTTIDRLDAQVTSLHTKLNEAEVSCGQYRDSAVEAEQLMQAVERDLDAADVEIAALKAANELVTHEKSELSAMLDHDRVVYVEGVRDRNSLWAENRRLRDVIVHQAALLAGCGA
jgi:chromosome segregation ATPase